MRWRHTHTLAVSEAPIGNKGEGGASHVESRGFIPGRVHRQKTPRAEGSRVILGEVQGASKATKVQSSKGQGGCRLTIQGPMRKEAGEAKNRESMGLRIIKNFLDNVHINRGKYIFKGNRVEGQRAN